MAIEDFEWEGDVELTGPSEVRLAATKAPKAEQASWFSRLRRSVWLEPMLKLGGMGALLLVLAFIGVLASRHGGTELSLPGGVRGAAMALGTSWLKPTLSVEPTAHAANATALAVPAPSGSSSAAPAPVPQAPGETKPGITPDGKVVLNVASADELTKLPGVGMKRALLIVALRTKLKRFKHPSELLRVKGIGPRGLQRMLPHLVLD